MRKSLIILSLALLVGCSGRNATPVATEPTAPLATVISLEDSLTVAACDTLRLGGMRSGEVIEQWVGVRNATATPIVITRTETTCGCTAIDYPSQPIAAGDTARIAVRFDSQGFYGWQFKRVRLYTSADVHPLTIYVEAEVE